MIFRNDCEHMKTIDCGGDVGYHCKPKPISKHDFMHSWKHREDCSIKNRNNNCVEFVGTRKHIRKAKKTT